MKPLIYILLIICGGSTGNAVIRPLTLDHNFFIRTPRSHKKHHKNWKQPQLTKAMVQIQKLKNNKKYKSCAVKSKRTLKISGKLKPWVAYKGLQCSHQILLSLVESGKKDLSNLSVVQNLLSQVDQHQQWLGKGTYRHLIKQKFSQVLQQLFFYQVKKNRSLAWKTFERLQEIKPWMSREERGHLYQAAGELAFAQQSVRLAYQYYLRSVLEKDNPRLRAKLKSIQSNAELDVVEALSLSQRQKKKVLSNLEPSKGERKIHDRMKAAMESGDLVSAIDDGVQLLRKYPGGQIGHWVSDRILDIYLKVSRKQADKYRVLKKRIVNQMKKTNASQLSKWMTKLYWRGDYWTAAHLGEAALDQTEGRINEEKLLRLSAKSLYYVGAYEDSEVFLKKLVREYSGNESALEALFFLGLMSFRKSNFALASTYFEKIMGIEKKGSRYLSSLYWLWWSQRKLLHTERVQQLALQLAEEYPLTYYGLQAHAFLNEGKLNWKIPKTKSAVYRMWLTENEKATWKRVIVLLQAGWYEEAKLELQVLPQPRTAEERAVWAKVMGTAFDYQNAFQMVYKAIETSKSWLTMDILKVLFPFEFEKSVTKWAQKNGVPPNLVYGLIKQESAFQLKAKSSASAVGLMQLVPVAVRDVQRDHPKLKKLKFPEDIYREDENIMVGTLYLKKMLRSAKGSWPLALASYNGGIGRVRSWFRQRKELSKYLQSPLLEAENEIWVEELPWSETTFYVKAVLRNFLLYSMIAQGEVQAKGPIWKL